jgi:hypothetical protein
MTGKIPTYGGKIPSVEIGNGRKKFRYWWKFLSVEKTSSGAWSIQYCGTRRIGQDLPTPFVSV